MPTSRDGWDKFDIITKALGGLLLPALIFMLGSAYNPHQKEAEEARVKADRIALLLPHVTSANAKERTITLQVMGYLASTNQFPKELLPILLNGVNDSDDAIATESAKVLATAVTQDSSLARSVQDGAERDSRAKGTVIKAATLAPSLGRAIRLSRLNADVETSKPFQGTWISSDSNTGGITRLVVYQEADQLYVHAWGKCHPTDCDWGSEKVTVAGNSASVNWDQGFVLRRMQLVIRDSATLAITMHSEYRDSRKPQDAEDVFRRE